MDAIASRQTMRATNYTRHGSTAGIQVVGGGMKISRDGVPSGTGMTAITIAMMTDADVRNFAGLAGRLIPGLRN